jgi:large subunit ribosomal protein L3
MAGHLGNARCTVRNLEVVQVDPDDNLLLVEGAVPGPDGGLVMIRHARKVSKGR